MHRRPVNPFYSNAYVRARKPHTCQDCADPIPPAALYLREVISELRTRAICLRCSVVRIRGHLSHDCKAVRDRIEQFGEAAGYAGEQQVLL